MDNQIVKDKDQAEDFQSFDMEHLWECTKCGYTIQLSKCNYRRTTSRLAISRQPCWSKNLWKKNITVKKLILEKGIMTEKDLDALST